MAKPVLQPLKAITGTNKCFYKIVQPNRSKGLITRIGKIFPRFGKYTFAFE